MKTLGKIFASGLLAVVPIVATLYLLVWIFSSAETLFDQTLNLLLPEAWRASAAGRLLQLPGVGVIAGLLMIFAVGLLMRAWVFRALFERVEGTMLSVPMVKSIYSAIRDFFAMVTQDESAESLKVVVVTLPGSTMRLVGFVTRNDFANLPEGIGGEGEVAVYFPMSYQIGGYTLFVPTDQITPVDMSREAAMRFVLTAGINSGDTPRPPA
ncbi:DUF502 domain-containing protein [Denitromonas iodatirespirans]|uniref:DUF502 domain-containing protein n=1 Tax=Denitromonas iodatirespirans TaxID=2795389 RepID=A0A944H994_DENI1|nr:DUF502 domain-containing protein [Denitromonas iodatirespirans]MBT0963173.1 DUF502 domain-containing protein [Denitromonas iodatirespirans]